MPQFSLPAVVYRGGTSRGIFFHARDLPQPGPDRDRVFLHAIDAWNPSQVDGLGSGTSHTSKCVVIGPPTRPDADIDYTFVQVGIGQLLADTKGTCGNLMAATAAFALDEGLIAAPAGADTLTVRVHDTNANKLLRITLPVRDGCCASQGAFALPGIVRPGALVRVDILEPGGGKTGSVLPLGPTTVLATPGGDFTASIIDLVNPLVFVDAADLGLTGAEPFASLAADTGVIETLNAIRDAAVVALGWADSADAARQSMAAIPKVAMLGRPKSYTATDGTDIREKDVDIVGRMLSMGRLHRTFAASALYCLAGACLLPGTIPHRLCRAAAEDERLIRIGHPDGVAPVRASLTSDGSDIAAVGMDRTVRRIMKGEVFVPYATASR